MEKYDDIMYLARPEPKTRPRMTLYDRAAQFAPFAALTGYDESLAEVRRTIQSRKDLGPDEAVCLDADLKKIAAGSIMRVTFFVPDGRKAGGNYDHHAGTVRWLNEIEGMLEFVDGTRIPLIDMVKVEFLQSKDTGGEI